MSPTAPTRTRVAFALLAGTLASMCLAARPSNAQTTVDVLSTFSSPACSVNRNLYSALVQGSDGKFFGTTDVASGVGGTIFSMTPAGVLSTVYTFSGADGSNPRTRLVLATDGNFYGTTAAGGAANLGIVFRVTSGGALTIVHAFAGGTTDGAVPTSLMQATDGNFYGTTTSGGAGSSGTVFRMASDGTVTILKSFVGGTADGSAPTTLLQASDGNFYGMTSGGGTSGNGTIFRMTPAGNVTFLYGSFQGVIQNGSRFSGSLPGGDLIQATDGNLYGTIADRTSPFVQAGQVFKITLAGTYSFFASLPGQNAALTAANDGNIYGIALNAQTFDNHADRVVFRLAPDGTRTTLSTVLESSCRSPSDAMIQAAEGKFYGTTGAGVTYRVGIAPSISPSTITTVTLRKAMLLANAVGLPGATFQWQVSTDSGGTWTNVTEGGAYAGATSSIRRPRRCSGGCQATRRCRQTTTATAERIPRCSDHQPGRGTSGLRPRTTRHRRRSSGGCRATCPRPTRPLRTRLRPPDPGRRVRSSPIWRGTAVTTTASAAPLQHS